MMDGSFDQAVHRLAPGLAFVERGKGQQEMPAGRVLRQQGRGERGNDVGRADSGRLAAGKRANTAWVGAPTVALKIADSA